MNEYKFEEKDDRFKYIVYTIGLFLLMVLSVQTYTTMYSRFIQDIILLPIVYSIPTLVVFLPIIFSVATFVIFLLSLDFITKETQYDEKSAKESQFSITLRELRNPSNSRIKRRKRIFLSLLSLSIIILLVSHCYILTIVIVVL